MGESTVVTVRLLCVVA